MSTDSTTPAADNVQQQIAAYESWNSWLYEAGSLVQLIAGGLSRVPSLAPPALTAIEAASHAFYTAVQGMNSEVVKAIKGLQQTPPVQPGVDFTSEELPGWPDSASPDLFASGWGAAQPLLRMLEQKLIASNPGHPIVVALEGLINAGDKLVQTLSDYYPRSA
jgi:hypothetical protein